MKIDDNILDIDLNALEMEAARQPKLIYKISEGLANIKDTIRNLENDLELTHANLTKLVRNKPGEFGLKEKPTETAIKSVIMTISKYTDKLEKRNRLLKDIDILKGLLNGLEHKKRMIELEVSLLSQNYYSKPYIKNEQWKQMVDDIDKRSLLSKGVKRKKKVKQK